MLPLSWGQIQHGYALALEGKTEAGIAEMLEGLASVRAVHVQVALALSLCWLSEGYVTAGQANHARKALGDAFTTMETTGERLYESELHRVRGEIALISDPPDLAEAERCFRIAIDTARSSGAKRWELRAATSLSALLSKQGKRDEAAGALAPVCASIPEADIADLRRAKSILDRLGA